MVATTFPVGYHDLHPDASMNFQMNRWFGWVGEPDMLEEMRIAAPRIATYADWKREFVALAERALQQGHILSLTVLIIVSWIRSKTARASWKVSGQECADTNSQTGD